MVPDGASETLGRKREHLLLFPGCRFGVRNASRTECLNALQVEINDPIIRSDQRTAI